MSVPSSMSASHGSYVFPESRHTPSSASRASATEGVGEDDEADAQGKSTGSPCGPIVAGTPQTLFGAIWAELTPGNQVLDCQLEEEALLLDEE